MQEIVITGIGVVSPIGIGKEAFWKSLCAGQSGVRCFSLFADADLPVPFGGEVADFDPKQWVRPRKSLKVMNRDIQMAFTAADLACVDAKVESGRVDPDRFGVVFGGELMTFDLDEIAPAYRSCLEGGRFDFRRWGQAAMTELYPLWLLKYLPNMSACHIGIAQDARGPCNTITMREASSLLAIVEASRILQRGQADIMLAGGTSSLVHPAVWTRSGEFPFSRRWDDPAAASRPFDAMRDGWVNGEGSAAFLLETRRHAEARGAGVLARILGAAAAFEPQRGQPLAGDAIRRAILGALGDANLTPRQVGHVNAHGMSTPHDDRIESQAICRTLGGVPVTAPKSYFGNLGAGSGAVEMAVSVLALVHGKVPPTLNYELPDPQCPIHVIHGRPAETGGRTALVLNHSPHGQAVAVAIGA